MAASLRSMKGMPWCHGGELLVGTTFHPEDSLMNDLVEPGLRLVVVVARLPRPTHTMTVFFICVVHYVNNIKVAKSFVVFSGLQKS